MSAFLEWSSGRHGVSMSYPAPGWSFIEDSSSMGGPVVQFQETGGAVNQQPANINITIIPDCNVSLQEFTQHSMAQMKQLLPSLDDLVTSDVTLGGLPGCSAIYGTQTGPYTMKFYQMWTVKEGTAYVLTFTVNKDDFAKHHAKVVQVFTSFKFLDDTQKAKIKMAEALRDATKPIGILVTNTLHVDTTYASGEKEEEDTEVKEEERSYYLQRPNSWTEVVSLPVDKKDVAPGASDAVREYKYSFDNEVTKQEEQYLMRLVVDRVTEGTSLQEYGEAYKREVAQLLRTSVGEVELTECKLGDADTGLAALRHKYSEGDAKSTVFRWLAVGVGSKKGHAFSLTCRTNLPVDSQRAVPMFNRFASSFSLTCPKFETDLPLVYDNLELGFSTRYPQGFDVETLQSTIIAFVNSAQKASAQYVTNCTINVHHELNPEMTLDNFADGLKNEAEMGMGAIDECMIVDARLAGRRGKSVTIVARMENIQVKATQICIMRNGQGLVWSFTTLKSMYNDEWKSIGEKMMKSFQLLPPIGV
eukprot:TRINITY_DN5655_c0_g1_i3.p1 TRINITY_DN5655_c0_g1~~TRINITY_DN5655_c0_g1_i3.p1  ORF type:complete len:555 (-),score=113.10 TRINITY_DN5655_c0_g1_i3:100-1692(-)